MEKDESYRNKWALGLTIVLSVLIFTGFAFYRGFFSIDFENVAAEIKPQKQTASAISAELVPSPIESSKETFRAAFGEINRQYQEFKKSILDVLVPFVTNIEVYERE